MRPAVRLAVFGLILSWGAVASAQDFAVAFGRGPQETVYVQFDDYQPAETWFLRRCQNRVTPDFRVLIKEHGDTLRIGLVNSALEADKTVCVVGRIPDIVKRYMR